MLSLQAAIIEINDQAVPAVIAYDENSNDLWFHKFKTLEAAEEWKKLAKTHGLLTVERLRKGLLNWVFVQG